MKVHSKGVGALFVTSLFVFVTYDLSNECSLLFFDAFLFPVSKYYKDMAVMDYILFVLIMPFFVFYLYSINLYLLTNSPKTFFKL